jgi:hypothetical protein
MEQDLLGFFDLISWFFSPAVLQRVWDTVCFLTSDILLPIGLEFRCIDHVLDESQGLRFSSSSIIAEGTLEAAGGSGPYDVIDRPQLAQ